MLSLPLGFAFYCVEAVCITPISKLFLQFDEQLVKNGLFRRPFYTWSVSLLLSSNLATMKKKISFFLSFFAKLSVSHQRKARDIVMMRLPTYKARERFLFFYFHASIWVVECQSLVLGLPCLLEQHEQQVD